MRAVEPDAGTGSGRPITCTRGSSTGALAGARMIASWPYSSKRPASSWMWRFTPPGVTQS